MLRLEGGLPGASPVRTGEARDRVSRRKSVSPTGAERRYFLSQMTRFLSLLSATKMASNFAGAVSLAFSLTV